jgi:hypothetical protein
MVSWSDVFLRRSKATVFKGEKVRDPYPMTPSLER